MTITAKIIEDSVCDHEDVPQLTTFQLRYPRFIHSEFMTHRTFSRNASSSRAIPVETMIKNIQADTAMPSHWGKNQPGMQADGETDETIYLGSALGEDSNAMFWHEEGYCPEDAWVNARDRAIEVAQAFHKAGYHKQVVNRLLEPFMHIEVVMTSTEAGLQNFFHLRCHKDAQPEIKILADLMRVAYDKSEPNILFNGDHHLPYISLIERREFPLDILLKLSTARCARVSYLTHDGENPDVLKDMALYDRLVGGDPLHASPTEHQARVCLTHPAEIGSAHPVSLSGNFEGAWVQHRKTLPGEFVREYHGDSLDG